MDQNKGKAIDLTLKLGPSNSDEQDNPPNPRNNEVNGTRVCKECGTNVTCMWRRGPDGPQTLCNACGLRFMRAPRRGGE